MVRITNDVVEESPHPRVGLVEHAVVDPLRHPPRRLLRQPSPERLAVVLHEVARALEHRVEQPLVMVALDRELDRPADQW